MLNEVLREKLQKKLVDVTCTIQQSRDDKKTQMSAITDLIRTLEKRQRAISRAVKNNDEDELISTFGEFYLEELGLKYDHINQKIEDDL